MTLWTGPHNVVAPEAIEMFVQDPTTPTNKLLMKIYTGILKLDGGFGSSGDLNRTWVHHLVTDQDGGVLYLDKFDTQHTYVGSTVVVAPASFHLFGSPHTVAVDAAVSFLTRLTLTGVSEDEVRAVAFLADLAILNGAIHRLSYQVTVLYRVTEELRRVSRADGWDGTYIPGQNIDSPLGEVAYE